MLLSRARAGNRAACDALIDRNRRYLLAVLHDLIPPTLRTDIPVEDVLQQTYLAVHERIDGFRYKGPGSLGAWVVSIARRQALRRMCCALRDRAHRSKTGAVVDHVASTNKSEGPDAEAILFELNSRFYEGILRLPKAEREVFVLHHLEDSPFSDVARKLGVSESTVRRRFAASITSLRTICGLATSAHTGSLRGSIPSEKG